MVYPFNRIATAIVIHYQPSSSLLFQFVLAVYIYINGTRVCYELSRVIDDDIQILCLLACYYYHSNTLTGSNPHIKTHLIHH